MIVSLVHDDRTFHVHIHHHLYSPYYYGTLMIKFTLSFPCFIGRDYHSFSDYFYCSLAHSLLYYITVLNKMDAVSLEKLIISVLLCSRLGGQTLPKLSRFIQHAQLKEYLFFFFFWKMKEYLIKQSQIIFN